MIKVKEEFAKNKYKFILCVLLAGCALCQLLITTYFTMFQGAEHMGIDSSWEYLKPLISAKEGRIFPINCFNSTTHPEIEKLILTVPLLNIFGNVFIAYGLSNLVVILLTAFLLVKISKELNLKLISVLIIINLYLCPYASNGYRVQNELGYIEIATGFSAHYCVAMLAFLLTVYFAIGNFSVKKEIAIAIVTYIVLAYITLCKGFTIVIWIGVPIIVYSLTKIFITNDIKLIYQRKNLYLFGCIIAMILGHKLGSLIGLEYLDSDINWVNSADFFKNLGNIIVGYAVLLGGLPAEGVTRVVTSFTGGVFIFGIIISVVFYVAVVYCFVKALKNKVDYNVLFLLIIIGTNIALLSLIAPEQVSDNYSVRYLVASALAGFILIGVFIENLDSKLVFKKFGVGILFCSIVFMDLYSDYFVAVADNSSWNVEELLEEIDKTDAGLVYFWDSEKTLVEPERVIRVLDMDRVYKSISYENMLENYGDYTYYDDSKEYNGATIIVTKSGDDVVPDSIMAEYSYLCDVGEYILYYCESNPVDLQAFTIGRR